MKTLKNTVFDETGNVELFVRIIIVVISIVLNDVNYDNVTSRR